MHELRIFGNIVFALLLMGFGLFPILNQYGVLNSNPLSFIPYTIKLLIISVSVLWLAIDGFGETHMMKTLSLITAAVLAVLIGVPALNLLGLINFALPGFFLALENYLLVVGGVFLLIGAFIYH